MESVMNAIILTAVLYAGNSGMYTSTRILWDLAYDIRELPNRAKWFLLGQLLLLFLCIFIISGQNFQAFMGGVIGWNSVVIPYVGLLLFLIVWLVYKVEHKSKLIPLKDCDFENKYP